ncbi:hypothetical protein Pmani_010793 [Petrolisthes manimaculis]|uniref:Uncharacterized protein n=1 Tax=Petrolisthes manimaculis TaxID=1843537 RepID=A0AAE1Q3S0_9EUCA|nr:hypothetical protein Pmani_010793 [Petrolisthes manimaculis]
MTYLSCLIFQATCFAEGWMDKQNLDPGHSVSPRKTPTVACIESYTVRGRHLHSPGWVEMTRRPTLDPLYKVGGASGGKLWSGKGRISKSYHLTPFIAS